MERTLSPPLTRDVSSVSLYPGPQPGERTALLAGDEEAGRFYVQETSGTFPNELGSKIQYERSYLQKLLPRQHRRYPQT